MQYLYYSPAAVLLYTLFNIEVTLNEMCTKQSDCVEDNQEICSICVSNVNAEGKCVYIYPKVYLSSPSCNRFSDQNCPLDCTPWGKCLTSIAGRNFSSYYFPYCRCGSTSNMSYGDKCQYNNPNNIPQYSYVKLKFTDMVPACETTTLEFTLHSWVKEMAKRTFHLFVKVDGASFNYVSKSMLQNTPFTRLEHYSTYYLKHAFPYKADKSVFRLRNRYIGYQTSVHIVIINIDNVLVFSNSWDIFVKYNELKCFPKITATNCADGILAPSVYLRNARLEMNIQVDYIADGSRENSVNDSKCKVSETMVWEIWKIDHNVLTNTDIYDYTQRRSISLEPFKLEIGLYKLNIEVINSGTEKKISNSVACYIKIACVPLVAKIEGGRERRVSPNLGVLLIADKSYDPNMPLYDQGHVFIEWSCINKTSSIKGQKSFVSSPMAISQHYFVSSSHLIPGAEYVCTLEVWTDKYKDVLDCSEKMSPKYASLTVKVANSNETQHGNVVIDCIYNCGLKVIPNNMLYLKARQPLIRTDTSNTTYVWTYQENGGSETLTDSIRDFGLRSYILIIKENSFQLAKNYTIIARIENTIWYAKYEFETYSLDFDADCSVFPENGIKGQTAFEINCTVYKSSTESSLSFEFYDKNEEEVKEGFIFSGRMLGTSRNGRLSDVHLTRGNLMIYILNERGLFLNKSLVVKLVNWNINDEILTELYHDITDRAQFGDVPGALETVSFIPDIIPDRMEPKKSEIFNSLLGFITHLSLHKFSDMKLSASTLANVLFTLNKPKQLQLEPYYVEKTFQSINHQADILSQKLLSGEVKNMSPREVKQVSISILNSLQAGLLCKDKRTKNIKEKEYDFSVLRQLRRASLSAEGIVDRVANTLSYIQTPGQPATTISSKDNKFVAWVMENDEMISVVELLSNMNDTPVILSDENFNDLKSMLNKNEEIALQVVSMEENIFWWSQSDVRSKLVSVSLKRQYENNNLLPIRYVDKPISILVDYDDNVMPTKIRTTTSMPDPSMDTLTLDLAVRIHRIEPALRSQMTIQFLFPPTNSSLRVFVIDQFRPDYAIMMEQGKTITNSSTTYDVPYYKHDEPYFLFMGVLPHSGVAINQTVEYAFKVSTTVCKVWAKAEWSSTGCHIIKVENSKQVRCECKHFSFFAAAFPVPPNQVDPYNDAKLFLTAFENPYVISFVSAILIIYILLFWLLWQLDRDLQRKQSIIVLDDNMPSDKAPYLVAVYTSSRLNAGTSAHVGIQIYGSEAESRRHILSCTYRKVFRRDADDWFLIYCPEPLGDVEALHIWHDNFGSHAEWYCEKIIVYDLIQNTETLFIVEDWLALNKNEFPEAYVMSAAVEDIKNVKSLFFDNLILGMREKHILLSCLLRHPRSELTRLQRLSVFMCSLMVGMLCSIMFYLPENKKDYVDGYKYSLNVRQMYVGIQTLIILVIVSYIVFCLFKKSYKITYKKNKTTLRLRSLSDKKSEIYSYDNNRQEVEGGSWYSNFVKIVTKTIKSNTLTPVNLPNSQPVVEVKRFWLFFSWTVCIIVICFSSYLIMLYGLKLGVVYSKEWLASLLIATGGDILIFTPLKIIILSSLLATALLKMYDLSLHRVDVRDLQLVALPNNVTHINKVIEMRSHPMYRPLKQQQRDKMLKREEFRRQTWRYIDYLITVLTLVVLSNLIYQMFLMNFYTTSHIARMMTQTKQEVLEILMYDEISDISSLEKYLQYTFVNCLYNLRWYNSRLLDTDAENTESEYWTSDFTHRMLGVPVIRQLRVTPCRCERSIFNNSHCTPNWSVKSQDQDDYGKRWKPASWSAVSTSNSPWRYTEPTSISWLNRFRLYSSSGVMYITGGYVQQLGPTRKDTEFKLADLMEDSWLDRNTRAVFIEFSLYNVNEDVFVQVTQMVEHLKSGIVLPMASASAFKTGASPNIWIVLFNVLLIYFLSRCIQIINRKGIAHFFSCYDNVCKAVTVILGSLSIVLFTIHYYVSTKYSESFHRQGLDDHFEFDTLVHYYLLLRLVVSLLLCFAILHTFSLMKTRISLMSHLRTITSSSKCIFWLTTACAAVVCGLSVLNVIFGISPKFNIKNIVINKRSLEFLQLNDFQYLHVQLFVITKIVSITLFMWCYVIIFIVFAKKVKNSNIFK